MRVLQVQSRIGNDVWVDLVCELCGHTESDVRAYDDNYYWAKIMPTKTCPACGKSRLDIEASDRAVIAAAGPNVTRRLP